MKQSWWCQHQAILLGSMDNIILASSWSHCFVHVFTFADSNLGVPIWNWESETYNKQHIGHMGVAGNQQMEQR